MIGLEQLYWLAGGWFALCAAIGWADRAHPRRWRNGGFWAVLALSFAAGSSLPDQANGVLALALVVLAGRRGLGERHPPEQPAGREAAALRHGNRLFWIALLIPATALIGALTLHRLQVFGVALFSATHGSLIALSLGVLVALVVGLWQFQSPLQLPLMEGKRLLDAVGWAAVLPQMLAALGAVFALAGLGEVMGRLLQAQSGLAAPTAAVAAYCLGMALLTVMMGNAFAAFPVMTAAVGLPVLVGVMGGNPAAVCAIGMLAGFCGTLMTPMAANFNVVPASLLELPDRDAAFNGVIRAQLPTALLMLAVNIGLMRWLAF